MKSYCGNAGTDDKNQLVENLRETLRLKDKELCETRRRLGEFKEENIGLNEANQTLETNLKSLNAKFADALSCNTRLTSERDSLNDELEIKCRQLSDQKAQHDEDVRNHKCSYDRLFMILTEVNKASAQNHHKMKSQVQKLQNEISAKKDELCTMKKKIKELERENDFNVMEINAQKNKLFESECKLKRMALISDKILKIRQTCDVCCCPEKKTDCQTTSTKPKCLPKDQCCSQPKPCAKPNDQSCTTVANVTADNSNVVDSTDLKNLFCQLENLRNDVCTSLKNKQ